METFSPLDERKALGRETIRAGAWAMTTLAAGRLVSLASLVWLARVLAPSDFGLLAFALAFITYAETIGDLGTSAALIYWPDRDRSRDAVAQLTFVISLAAGLAWFALTLVLAPSVAAFFQSEPTTDILRVLALTFPIKALGATHDALAQKDLRFRARFLPEVGLSTFKGIVAIALASAGFGVWSLVLGHLAGVLAWTVLLWIVVPWRPGASLRLDLVRPVLTYGRDIVAVNVLGAIVHHADVIVVGRMLGASALGFYQVAGRLPDVTLMMVVRAAGRILFPAFARLGADTASLRAAYLSALKYVSLLVAPAAAALMILAGPIVRVFFGPAWEPSVPILRALAAYAGLRALGTHAGDVLKAVGRPGVLAWFGVAKAAMVVPALILAARIDAAAVATALAAVTLLSVLLNLAIVSRLLRVRTADVFAAIRPATACTMVMSIVLAAWVRATAPAPVLLVLGGGLALGCAVYLAFLRLITPEIPATIMGALGIGRPFGRSPGEPRTAAAGGRQ
ncbi:MAG TPA: lipopolysaccharide biosynthesis protein [Vicinamibacterales bacterium]|nr:lipopolysaccharide biosynthesis protein [Vicinamibacterales bacterium]